MVQKCVAYSCNEKSVKGTPLSFHSFPKDEIMKKKWTIALRHEEFTPSKHSRICSKHFTEDCFDREAFGNGRKLKANVVPSVFNFPSHLQARKCKRKVPIERVVPTEVRPSSPKIDDLQLQQPSVSTEFCPVGKKQRLTFLGDFTDQHLNSPRKAKSYLKTANEMRQKYQKKIKILRQLCRRAADKICSLQAVISHLKQKQLISDNAADTLEKSLPPAVAEILRRWKKGSTRESYPPELKTFALTLNFYSSSAYNYVRKMFFKCLPHPVTLQKWYSSVDGRPGFSSEACTALKLKAAENAAHGKPMLCSIMMDEMAIRKHVEFDGQRFDGYLDLGTGLDDDSLPEAREALVFMAVALNGSWKIPIGYFLIDGLGGVERANLIKQCLKILCDCGVVVASLTFDGAASNLSMAEHLDAKFSLPELKTWITDPCTGKPVFLFLDPCHMLKLIRNCLASRGSLIDDRGMVQWKYIVKLEELQRSEGLHAATKLGRRHVNWFREKMKVKLAAQTFSKSVADALKFCSQDLKLMEFEGSESTFKFIEVFNNLFDILNSRNLLSKGFKAPLSEKNIEVREFLLKAKSYILTLRESEGGPPMYLSKRKTGFLGFLVCIESLLGLYDYTVKSDLLKFLLTYKVSQDHLELFFSAVRSRGGHNNNPTAKQFETAFKRLLVHIQIGTTSSSNCQAIDSTTILSATSGKKKAVNDPFLNLDGSESVCNERVDHDHNYCAPATSSMLSKYVEDVVGYIAGFVVRKLKNDIQCDVCCRALLTEETDLLLLNRKNVGGLVYPAEDVVKLCRVAEKYCRIELSNSCLQNVSQNSIMCRIMRAMDPSLFSVLDEHILHQQPLHNHKIQLLKSVLAKYLNIRLYHTGKQSADNLHQQRIRSVCTKLVLFKNQ